MHFNAGEFVGGTTCQNVKEKKKAEKTICMWTQLMKEEVQENQQQDISKMITVLLGHLFSSVWMKTCSPKKPVTAWLECILIKHLVRILLCLLSPYVHTLRTILRPLKDTVQLLLKRVNRLSDLRTGCYWRLVATHRRHRITATVVGGCSLTVFQPQW